MGTHLAAKRLLPGLAAALALALCASGCGSSSATLDPVASAADVTSHLGGAHIALTVEVGSAGTSTQFTMSGQGFFNYRTQEGSLGFDMTGLPTSAATTLPSGALHMQEIIKDSTLYVGSSLFASKLPGGARWLKLDLRRFAAAIGFNLQQLAGGQSNPAQLLEFLRASSGGVTRVKRELVRGVPTTRYRGTIDLGKLADVLPTGNRDQVRAALAKLIAQTGTSSIPVEVWVDDHKLVRRITMSLSLPVSAQSLQMRMTVELFDFGPTPPVTAPPGSEVFDATAAALAGLHGSGG